MLDRAVARMMSDAKKYEWKRRGGRYVELWFGGRLIAKTINGKEYVVRGVHDWGSIDESNEDVMENEWDPDFRPESYWPDDSDTETHGDPDSVSSEIVIATISLNTSSSHDFPLIAAKSVLAKPEGRQVRYRVISHGWNHRRTSSEISSQPLTNEELASLLNSIELAIRTPHPGSLTRFTYVSSCFYPKFGTYILRKSREWAARSAEDSDESCPFCGGPHASDFDHECAELLEEFRLEREKSRIQQEQQESLIAPFFDRIRTVVERWKASRPPRHGAGGLVAQNARATWSVLESYLRDYVVMHRAMPRGPHRLEYKFASQDPLNMQVEL
jgi:hypothetical protein